MFVSFTTPKDIRDKYKQKSIELFSSKHKSKLHKDSDLIYILHPIDLVI